MKKRHKIKRLAAENILLRSILEVQKFQIEFYRRELIQLSRKQEPFKAGGIVPDNNGEIKL